MANSINFDKFNKRMKLIADRVGKNAGEAVKRAALEADQVGVLRTPVDTGRARANWVASIGEPSTEDNPGPDLGSRDANETKSTAEALAQAQTALAGYKLSLGPIYLVNNTEYILFLDDGSSDQAPSGISPFMLQAARAVLKKAKLLKGV